MNNIQHYNNLSRDDLYAIIYLRNEVFIVEQNCPYQDCDGKDQDAYHYTLKEDGLLIAYCRILKPGISYAEYAIGRVIIKASHRGQKLGRKMMLESMSYITDTLKGKSIRISAQAYLEKFYRDLGFKVVSEVYLEDDIPHIEMLFLIE